MSQAAYRDRLLCCLIDRYEQSQAFSTGQPSRRRPQLRLQQSELAADYCDETDYCKREQINQALVQLQSEGVIEVQWAAYREGEEAERVFLQYAAVPDAYQLAGRTPREAKLSALRAVLVPLADHPWGWVRAWWQETDQLLATKKPAGLQLESQELYADLVQVLQQLPVFAEGVLKRNFSQQVLGDSKRFEQGVERQLLRLLQRFSPEEYETDEQYLDSVGIIANPELTLVAGPLTLQADNRVLAVGHFPGGCGLSDQTVRQCCVLRVGAQAILTIENLATYHAVVAALSAQEERLQVLCLYTGGFPRRSTQRLLRKLGECLVEHERSVSVWHWGDIDYGGIRILQFLKLHFFSDLQPLLMDTLTYARHSPGGLSFSLEYAKKLRRLLTDDAYSAWYPLIETMLAQGVRVEQEGIPVREALAGLMAACADGPVRQ